MVPTKQVMARYIEAALHNVDESKVKDHWTTARMKKPKKVLTYEFGLALEAQAKKGQRGIK